MTQCVIIINTNINKGEVIILHNRPHKAVLRGIKTIRGPWKRGETIPFKNHKKAQKLVLAYQKIDNGKKKQEILDRLCCGYFHLINAYAQEFSSNEFQLENLIQEGYCALIQAAQNYDYQKAAWITYVSWEIKGSMHHYMRDKPHIVRQPAKFYDLAPKITSRLKTLHGDHNNIARVFSPTEAKVVEEYEQYRTCFGSVLPISGKNQDDEAEDLTETEVLANHNLSTSSLQDVENKIFLEQLRKHLNELEFKVLYSYYITEATKVALCGKLGMNNHQLNKVLNSAVEKMKKFLYA